VAVAVKDPDEPCTNVVLLAEVMAGWSVTIRENDCVASGLMPLVALITTAKVPVTVGVPDSAPPEDNVTPDGSEPLVIEKVGGATPVAVTSNRPAEPFWNTALVPEVNVGDAP